MTTRGCALPGVPKDPCQFTKGSQGDLTHTWLAERVEMTDWLLSQFEPAGMEYL